VKTFKLTLRPFSKFSVNDSKEILENTFRKLTKWAERKFKRLHRRKTAPENGMNPGYPKLDTLIGSATVLQHIKDAVTSLEGSSPTLNDAVTAFRAL